MGLKPTRYYSKIQEKTVAKEFGGKLSSNSGAAKFSAGDVYTKDVLFECKTVTKESKSYSVKKEVLEKLKKEAFELGKQFPVMVFNFEPGGELFFVVSQKHFKKLIEAYTEIQEKDI